MVNAPQCPPSLYYLIGAKKEGGRNGESEKFRRVAVDHELELRGLLDGEIGGLGALENLVYVGSCAPVQFRDIRTVRHQASGVHDGPKPVDGWQSVPGGQLYDAGSMSVEKGHVWHKQTVCAAGYCHSQARLESIEQSTAERTEAHNTTIRRGS